MIQFLHFFLFLFLDNFPFQLKTSNSRKTLMTCSFITKLLCRYVIECCTPRFFSAFPLGCKALLTVYLHFGASNFLALTVFELFEIVTTATEDSSVTNTDPECQRPVYILCRKLQISTTLFCARFLNSRRNTPENFLYRCKVNKKNVRTLSIQ